MPADTKARRPVGRPRADGRPPLARGDVLAVAARLIGTHGYAGTSLRMIADELGASAPSISQMFGSKQRLLIELVEYLASMSVSFHEQLRELDPPPAVRLHKMVLEEVRAVASASQSLMAIFYLPELRLPEFAEAQAARRRMISFYLAVLDAGVASGVFRPVNTVTMAEQVFQLTETSIVALDRSKMASPAETARQSADFVLRGLLVRPATFDRIASASTRIRLTMA